MRALELELRSGAQGRKPAAFDKCQPRHGRAKVPSRSPRTFISLGSDQYGFGREERGLFSQRPATSPALGRSADSLEFHRVRGWRISERCRRLRRPACRSCLGRSPADRSVASLLQSMPKSRPSPCSTAPWPCRHCRGTCRCPRPKLHLPAYPSQSPALGRCCCFARYMTTDFPDCLTRPVPGFPRLFGLCRSAAPVLTVSEVGAVALSD